MVEIAKVKCRQCGHEWAPRTAHPKRCRKCGSYNWNQQKKADSA